MIPSEIKGFFKKKKKKLIGSKPLTLFFCDEGNYLIRRSPSRSISESSRTQSKMRNELMNAWAYSVPSHTPEVAWLPRDLNITCN